MTPQGKTVTTKQGGTTPRTRYPNPIADRYEDLYQAVIDARARIEQGTATPEDRELTQEWDHTSRFAGALDRTCHGLGEEFLRDSGWIRE